MAKTDKTKLRSPQIDVIWKDNVPEASYFKSNEYSTLIKALGKRFALKEPHNSFAKIRTSLDRSGIPYELK